MRFEQYLIWLTVIFDKCKRENMKIRIYFVIIIH